MAGFFLVMPVIVTVLVMGFLLSIFENVLKEPLDAVVPGGYRPGMGIAALLVIIYLMGLAATFVLGRRLLGVGHGLVEMIPVVRGIYRTARQAMEILTAVTSPETSKYSTVVLVEFPGYGLRSIGLVTSTIEDQDGKTLLAVYMPTSPFPTSGFLVFLPPEQVSTTDISVDDAMKLIVSAGIVSPGKVSSDPLATPIWVPASPEDISDKGVLTEDPRRGQREASNQ
ncbi:MAG: DUF502 domain-containing protein [Dehalococcoidia bacterium]|nr:DUF502 domain-containing protein [Dehalococcoidia bacterium]